MVYRELRETCSKLGEEMFSKSAEAGSKGTNYFSWQIKCNVIIDY